jgi:hypothetical protein
MKLLQEKPEPRSVWEESTALAKKQRIDYDCTNIHVLLGERGLVCRSIDLKSMPTPALNAFSGGLT